MSKNVDRTYRTNPSKFQNDLTQKINHDAARQYDSWETKGRLPLVIRLKNRFGRRNKVTLSGNR